MFTAKFWREAAERAVKTGAQALIGLWVGDGVFNAWTVDVRLAGGVAAGAVLLSLLSSLASSAVGEKGSPSAIG